MPELPELEIARRQLERWATGRTLRSVALPDPAVVRKSLSTKPSDAVPDAASVVAPLVGRTPDAFQRHGKRIAVGFGDRAVCAHFGMTGLLNRRPAADPPPPFARVGLHLSDDQVIWLADGRRFGCITVVPAAEAGPILRANQGPDALAEALDGRALAAALKCKKPVKPTLMEQDRLAGLGNIHAAEACFRAKIHPATRCDRVDPAAWDRLAEAVVAQLRWAIAEEDTDGDVAYVNLGGPNPFSVYGREGEGCGTCGTKIVSEEQAGRTTFWCPTCQPEA